MRAPAGQSRASSNVAAGGDPEQGPHPGKTRSYTFLLSAAKLVVGGGLIAGVLSVLDWHKLALIIATLDASTLGWTVLGSLGVLLLLAARWYVMVSPLVPLPFVQHLGLYMFGMLLSTFTPANIGSDVFRYASLHGDGVAGLSLVGLFIQEKLLLLMGYLMIMVATVTLIGTIDPDLALAHRGLFAGSAGLALAGLGLLGASPKLFGSRRSRPARRIQPRMWVPEAWRGSFGALTRQFQGLSDTMAFGSPRRFAELMAITLASMAVWLVVVWFLGGRLGITMPLAQLCFVTIAVELVRWLPISLQGIGVREGAFAGLFHILGHDPERGFLLGGTAYIILQVAIVLAGIGGAVVRVTSLGGRQRDVGGMARSDPALRCRRTRTLPGRTPRRPRVT